MFFAERPSRLEYTLQNNANLMGRFQPRQRAGINYMRGEAALPRTPRRAALASARPNNSDRPIDVSIGDQNCMSAWPRIDLS